METVRKLPKHVALSPHLRERAAFYIIVTLSGIRYYVAATPAVRRLFELDSNGKEGKLDRRRRFDSFRKTDALRDIVSSLHLQVRDVVLGGIEDDVTRALLDRMREVMAPTVRARVEDAAAERAPLLLQEKTGD